jgi:hypothetical protein
VAEYRRRMPFRQPPLTPVRLLTHIYRYTPRYVVICSPSVAPRRSENDVSIPAEQRYCIEAGTYRRTQQTCHRQRTLQTSHLLTAARKRCAAMSRHQENKRE